MLLDSVVGCVYTFAMRSHAGALGSGAGFRSVRSGTRAVIASALVVATGLVFTHDARADGLRCGSKIVSSGARPHEVRAKCGDPDAVDQRVEYETLRRRVRVPCPHNSPRAVCEMEEQYTVTHTVDTWTYDFGPRRFVHYVVFVDSSLARVETGSYGVKDVQEEP